MNHAIKRYGAISGAALALAAGYGLVGAFWAVAAALLVAASWVIGRQRNKRWVTSGSFTLLVLLSALSPLFGAAPGWPIAAVVFSLIGWNQGHFARLVASVERVDGKELIEQRYRRRLMATAALGAMLAGLTPLIQLNFGFGIALFLGVIAILGFGRAIAYLRRESV